MSSIYYHNASRYSYVIFPGNIHKPCIQVGQPERVKKVTVKVKIYDFERDKVIQQYKEAC
jgi:hypothetical protein